MSFDDEFGDCAVFEAWVAAASQLEAGPGSSITVLGQTMIKVYWEKVTTVGPVTGGQSEHSQDVLIFSCDLDLTKDARFWPPDVDRTDLKKGRRARKFDKLPDIEAGPTCHHYEIEL